MKIKKILATLLAAAFAFPLAACSPRTVSGGGNGGGTGDVPPEDDGFGTLSVCDTFAWLGDYPATEFVLRFSKPEKAEAVQYTYDETAIELDAARRTVKALKAGEYTVGVKSEHFDASFTVTCESIDKDLPNRAYDLTTHADGSAKYWDSRVRNFEFDWNANGQNNSTTIFIGDSFFDATAFWTSFYGDYEGKDALCWGIGSTTTCSWETIHFELLRKIAPKNVAMHCGTNNVFDLKQDANYVTSSLERVFTLMHDRMPKAKLYWFNITKRYHANADEGNAVAAEINRRFAEWADGRSWLTVIDTCSKLKIDKIKPDGIHPNDDGYAIFIDELAKSGIKINDKG